MRWLGRAPILAVFLLAGCATPYRHLSGRFGYDDFRISANVFEISFAGNGYTPPSVVNRYVLRRASEVTLENGFTHFKVLFERDETLLGSAGMTSGSGTASTYNGGQFATGNYSGQSVQVPLRFPAARMRIQCRNEAAATEDEVISAEVYLRYNFPESLENADAATPTSRIFAKP